MTIVQFIQSIALACTGKVVSFFHGEKWEQNTQDENPIFPFIILDHPIKGVDKILPQGNQETTYSLAVAFFDKSEIDYPQDSTTIPNHQAILDRMYLVKREFVTRVHNSNYVKSIKSAKTTEVINYMDLNVTGILLEFEIVVVDNTAVCDTIYLVGYDANGVMYFVTDSNGNKIKI